jgi:hypothetical protein
VRISSVTQRRSSGVASRQTSGLLQTCATIVYCALSWLATARSSGVTHTWSFAVASRHTYGDTHASQPYSSFQQYGLPGHLNAGLAQLETQVLPLQLAVSFFCAGMQVWSS